MTSEKCFDRRWPRIKAIFEEVQACKIAAENAQWRMHEEILRTGRVRPKPTCQQFINFRKGWLLCTELGAKLNFLTSWAFGWTTRRNEPWFLDDIRSRRHILFYSNTGGIPEMGTWPFGHLLPV